MFPLTPGLTIKAFDDSSALWKDLLATWEECGESQLVLASPYAQQRFLHKAQNSLWDHRVTITSKLTSKWRQERGIPRPLRRLELVHALTSFLEDEQLPEDLRRLRESPAAVEELLTHLNDIEARADRDYVPYTPVEHGIAHLRETLSKAHYLGEVASLSRVAREAQNVNADRPLLFAPVAQPTPHFAGLAKGLAVQQRIVLYLLTTAAQLNTLVEQANLTTDVQTNWTGGYTSRLFTAKRPQRQRDERHHWMEAAEESEAAVDLAWAWFQQGVPAHKIAIVCSRANEHTQRLAALASQRDLPLHVRGRVSARDTSLSALLVRIAEHDLTDPFMRAELLTGDGERYRLEESHLQAVQAAPDGPPRMRTLHDLGMELLAVEQPPLSADVGRAHAWLNGLASDIAAYETSGLAPALAVEGVKAARSARLTFGDVDGVAVTSYDEAAGLQFTHGVYLSLHESGYPPRTERSPFVSDAAYATALLHPPDRRPEFVSAVTASEYAVFVRRASEGDTPGAFWEESLRAATPAKKSRPQPMPSPGLGRQRVLQRLARSGVPHALLDEVQHRALRRRLPRGVLNGQRDQYSVTELELFLNCPYGWFVQHVLRPQQPSSPEAQRGVLLHSLLEDSLGRPPAQRQEAVRELVADAVKSGRLPKLEEATEVQRLSRVLERYAGADWPFTVSHQEQRLRSEQLLPNAVITGRADRVDIGPAGALVIDYKSGRKPSRKSPAERQKELQRYLYPLMAAEQFDVEPLGGIYVSVRYGAHDGSLTQSVGALDDGFVDYDWKKDSSIALDLAGEAITRIEQGDWELIGEKCMPWCAHHLMSQSVRAA